MSLTARQDEVMALAADGLNDKEIASRLGLSDTTVRHHRLAAYERLGATSREQAGARWARLQRRRRTLAAAGQLVLL